MTVKVTISAKELQSIISDHLDKVDLAVTGSKVSDINCRANKENLGDNFEIEVTLTNQ